MEKKEVAIGRPVAVAGATLIPVAEVSVRCWRRRGVISFFGARKPGSVVVVTPLGKRAFHVTGEEVALDQLIREVPGIEEVLEAI
ncbi:hypothetical protein ACFLYR_01875 [Chloroflexota bacterium]